MFDQLVKRKFHAEGTSTQYTGFISKTNVFVECSTLLYRISRTELEKVAN